MVIPMQPSSVVLSWGPPRMGTTWMFNILRELLTVAEVPVGIVADGLEGPAPDWGGAVLIKSHRADPLSLVNEYDARLDLLACVMVRDARSTFRSLLRTQTAKRSELIAWLERDLDSYEEVLPHMRHVAIVREEWVSSRSSEVVSRLADFLGLNLGDERAGEVARKFDKAEVKKVVDQLDSAEAWSGDFTHFDRDSQWHAGHIGPSDQKEVELTTQEVERLASVQSRVDALVDRFPIWEACNSSSREFTSRTTAMDYVIARHELIGPKPPTVRARLLDVLHQIFTAKA